MKTKKVAAIVQIVPPTDTKSALLRIGDKASGLPFADIELSLGDLEALLYGKQTICTLTAYGIGRYLGNNKVVESRTVPYPGSVGDDMAQIQAWVTTNKEELGWELDPKVRPSDIHQLGGQLYITYHVFKYVKP